MPCPLAGAWQSLGRCPEQAAVAVAVSWIAWIRWDG